MPPMTYMCDQLGLEVILNPAGNNLTSPNFSFFHGNMLSLWKFASNEMLGNAIDQFDQDENKVALLGQVQVFLQENSVSITDIIISTQRQQINANDNGLFNIDLNIELVKDLCSKDHQINTLIFSNSVTNGANGVGIYQNGIGNGQINISKRDAFSLFLRACQIVGIQVEIQLFDQINWTIANLANLPWLLLNTTNKLIFHIRLTCNNSSHDGSREFVVITPPSPGGRAILGLQHNANWLQYLNMNPGAVVNDYRRGVWVNAMVTGDHALINNWQ